MRRQESQQWVEAEKQEGIQGKKQPGRFATAQKRCHKSTTGLYPLNENSLLRMHVAFSDTAHTASSLSEDPRCHRLESELGSHFAEPGSRASQWAALSWALAQIGFLVSVPWADE